MSDLIFQLCEAIRQRDELVCTMSDVTLTLCPHVLYESPDGHSFWVGGIRMPAVIPVHIPLRELLDVKTTGRSFGPDPHFNLDDPRYDNAVAVIETPWPQRCTSGRAQESSPLLVGLSQTSYDSGYHARFRSSFWFGLHKVRRA